MYEEYTVRISSVRQHNEGNVIIGLPAKKISSFTKEASSRVRRNVTLSPRRPVTKELSAEQLFGHKMLSLINDKT